MAGGKLQGRKERRFPENLLQGRKADCKREMVLLGIRKWLFANFLIL